MKNGGGEVPMSVFPIRAVNRRITVEGLLLSVGALFQSPIYAATEGERHD